MRTFLLGLLIGGLVVWGAIVSLDDGPLPSPESSGPAGPRESEPPPERSPVPPPDGLPPPVVPGETRSSFAPGTANLRIGDWYTFGQDQATDEGGDILCQDIRHGASLRCPHGTLPVDLPLGVLGLPKQSAELAALVVDAPDALPRRDAWVRSHPSDRDAGVVLIRSAAERTYKVWLVKEEPHAEALQRRVHLAWAEVPVKPGGGVARLATSKGVDVAGPTQKDIRRIIAAGRAVPGDSFADQLSGTYVRPDEWPEKLSLRKQRVPPRRTTTRDGGRVQLPRRTVRGGRDRAERESGPPVLLGRRGPRRHGGRRGR